jgi:hypothetical protein
MGWWVVLVLAGLFGLLAVDRLLLGAESRGWIFYRRHRPSTGTASTGVLTVMSIYQPGHEHVVNERFQTAAKVEEVDDDEPLEPLLPLSRGSRASHSGEA